MTALIVTLMARLEVTIEPPVKKDSPTDTTNGASTDIPTIPQTTKPINDHS